MFFMISIVTNDQDLMIFRRSGCEVKALRYLHLSEAVVKVCAGVYSNMGPQKTLRCRS